MRPQMKKVSKKSFDKPLYQLGQILSLDRLLCDYEVLHRAIYNKKPKIEMHGLWVYINNKRFSAKSLQKYLQHLELMYAGTGNQPNKD